MEHNDNKENQELELNQEASTVENEAVEVDVEPTKEIEGMEAAADVEANTETLLETIPETNTEATAEIVDTPTVKAEYKPLKKKRTGGFKRAMSYVLVGVICSVIGGGAAVGAMMYVVPNSTAFKDSALYKALAQNKSVATSKTQATSYVTPTGTGLTVAEIAKKVGPAVVGVSTKSVVSNRSIFGNSSSVQQGTGSGVIFSDKGYIITNYHVIEGASTITVILNNNKEVKAKEINHDATNDIAVIQITDKVDLPGIAELGDSSTLQVGELAVAIGNPLGTELLGSVTTGIISAVDRQIDSQTVKFIQTDAAISPGNSGGPLINSQGQVIGINAEKMVSSGAEGLGFAIPINLVKSKVDGLISNPVKETPSTSANASSQLMMGIGIQEIDQATAQADNKTVGIEVLQVEKGSPAETAGIQLGDIIIKFDGQTVKTAAELNALKAKHKVGDTVKITVVRNGKSKEISLKFFQAN